MEQNKDDIFKAFTAKALKRLQEKKTRRYKTLYVPSIDQNIKIRNLDYQEVVECAEIENEPDPNASDKYCVYIAVAEPDLRAAALNLKEQGEIQNYTDIVDIFDVSEITDIAMEVMKLSNVIGKRVTVIEELKN